MRDFYLLSPREFHEAMEDHKRMQEERIQPIRLICEVIREIGKLIHNNAFGRKQAHKINDARRLLRFSWETPKLQTVDEMKKIILGIAHVKGVVVEQKGKKVEM